MRQRIMAVLLAAACVITVFGGCRGPGPESSEEADFPVSVNGIMIDAAPLRVAVLSPSLAEIASDMGYGGILCGRADECDRPESVAQLPSAGSLLTPDTAIIQRWFPDFVLVQSEPDEQTSAEFHNAGIPVLVIPAAEKGGDLLEMYRAVGQAFSGKLTGSAAGDQYMIDIETEMSAIGDKVLTHFGNMSEEDRVRVLYVADLYGHVATGDSLVHNILTAAGANNAAAGGEKWNAAAEQIAGAQVIFCPEEIAGRIKELPLYENTPAVKNAKIFGIDHRMVERQSKCIVRATEYIAAILFPDAFEQ